MQRFRLEACDFGREPPGGGIRGRVAANLSCLAIADHQETVRSPRCDNHRRHGSCQPAAECARWRRFFEPVPSSSVAENGRGPCAPFESPR